MPPNASHRVARTKAQGVGNVSLRFLGATDKNLTSGDNCMGMSEISIQRQCVLTFGDALYSPLGVYID